MKIILQRVLSASVEVDGKIVGKIWNGLLLFIGIAKNDTKEDAEKLLKKMVNLRIFEDENGKMNKSVLNVGGEILSVSQFTLLADYKKWNRPSFSDAENPEIAKKLWEFCNEKIREYLGNVETGIFGADMKISLVNDGPVTMVLESEKLR